MLNKDAYYVKATQRAIFAPLFLHFPALSLTVFG
jgi:hypothetical protein